MEEPNFSGPIPGMSLTSEAEGRPWHQPPQYPQVEDAAGFYIGQLSDEKIAPQVLDFIEMGYPLITIAHSFQLGGVMTGKHTIDVGILITPILVEYMIGMAEDAEIEYKMGDEPDLDAPDDAMIASAMKASKKPMEYEPEEEMAEDAEEEMIEEPMGIMMRRI